VLASPRNRNVPNAAPGAFDYRCVGHLNQATLSERRPGPEDRVGNRSKRRRRADSSARPPEAKLPPRPFVVADVRRRLVSLALLCVCASSLPATAQASQPNVVSDCNAHARLTQHYSAGQLENALGTMQADVKEYTDCYDLIQRALLVDLGRLHPIASGSRQSHGSNFLTAPVIVAIAVVALASMLLAIVFGRRRRE
jgi:hypothetical protein